MRRVWPFRRKREARQEDLGPVWRAAPQAWRDVAPIQRAVGVPPVVNTLAGFTDSLSAWANPAILAPLGHRFAPTEPAGTVYHLVQPAPATGAPPMPVRQPPVLPGDRSPRSVPVQRRFASDAPADGDTAAVVAVEVAEVVAPSLAEGAPILPQAAVPSVESAPQPPAVPQPPVVPPVVARAKAVGPVQTPIDTSVRPPAVGSVESPAAWGESPPVKTFGSLAAGPVETSPVETTGSPVAGPVESSPVETSGPPAAGLVGSIGPAPMTSAARLAEVGPTGETGQPSTRGSTALPVAQRTVTQRTVTQQPVAQRAESDRTEASRMAAVPGPAAALVVPLIGTAPPVGLRRGLAEAGPALSAVRPTVVPPAPAAGPTRQRRAATGPSRSVSHLISQRVIGDGSSPGTRSLPVGQRPGVEALGVLANGGAAGTAGRWPGGTAARGQPGPTRSAAVSAGGSLQRAAPLPLPTVSRTTSPPHPRSVPLSPQARTEPDIMPVTGGQVGWTGPGSNTMAGAEVVQRAATVDEAPPAEEAGAPSSAGVPAEGQPATSGQVSQPPAPERPGQPEPDELVKLLFDPLLRRLRTELRLDRERRGMVTDRW